MDHSEPIRPSDDQRTEVTAIGTLGRVGVLPLKDRELVQAELTVDEETFGVEIHGELAQKTAGMAEGSLVQVNGKLKTWKWKTQGQKDRDRVVILAERVELLRRPDRKKKRV